MLNLVKTAKENFPKPYEQYVFCSPNCGLVSDTRHQDYLQDMERSAHPTPVVFLDHLPTLEEVMEKSSGKRTLLFLDDFSTLLWSSTTVCDLFTRLSSHGCIDTVMSCHQGNCSKLGHLYSMIMQKIGRAHV